MCAKPGCNVVEISALLGGAAEKVLRAIPHSQQNGVDNIEDTSRLERLGFPWTEAAGMYTAQGIFREANGHVTEVLLILGGKAGLFLKDVDHLSKGAHFSVNHVLGENVESVDYVIPISQSILHHKFISGSDEAISQITTNIRRAVNQICAILLEFRGPMLLEHRARLEAYRLIGRNDRPKKTSRRRERREAGICT